jgi:hypothetical protein
LKTLLFGCLIEEEREIKEAEVAKLLLRTGAIREVEVEVELEVELERVEAAGFRKREDFFGLPLIYLFLYLKVGESRVLQRRKKTLEGFKPLRRREGSRI